MFSFNARKKSLDFAPLIRRICDITAFDAHLASQARCENRYNRTIPVVHCPWIDDQPVNDKSQLAITKDLSDRGVGLILSHVLEGEVVIGFWLTSEELEEPWFFRATIRSNEPIGGGLWYVGAQFQEFLNTDYRDELRQMMTLATKLLPPVESAATV